MAGTSPRPAGNRFGLPDLGIGIGLRTPHYREIAAGGSTVPWFEIISENFAYTEGRPLAILERIAERHPIVMHGVSLGLGSADPLDRNHLKALRRLRDRVGALWVSDHLCWTGIQGRNSHDLLPMPYTEEALRHCIDRVRQVQDVLEAPFHLENPSTYVEFAASTMPEWEFLGRLSDGADCGLLLDVNNIYVSSRNHGFATATYMDAVPWDRVVQLHVSGHDDEGTHCVDTHVCPVVDPVWRLLGEAWHRAKGVSVLLEWDTDIPDLATVHAEARKAEGFIAAAGSPPAATATPRRSDSDTAVAARSPTRRSAGVP